MLLSKADITQAQVDEGCKKLENAINKLVLKPVMKPVDKSRLSSLAQTCGKKNRIFTLKPVGIRLHRH